jgi:diacylglycerol kinase (CTP)
MIAYWQAAHSDVMKRTMIEGTSLKNRSDIHLARKLWHVTGVMTVIVLYHNLDRQVSVLAACLAALVVITLDILRQKIPELNRTLTFMFGPFMRDSEKNNMAAMSYLLFGVFAIVLLFPPKVATLSFLFLCFGDPIASFFGIHFGKDKLIGNKSLQGSMAAFVCCTIISFIFFWSKGIMLERIVLVSLLAGLIGSVSELIPIGKIDDNLSFPLLSSILLYGLFYVFGGF